VAAVLEVANQMTPTPNQIILGHNLLVLRTWPDACVDSIITDPPYGLKFMGKAWDHDVPKTTLWRQVFRVLKPGGHLLSFFGTRTYHRGVCAIEDAGFEIRDQIQWVYSSGFPKGLRPCPGIWRDVLKWQSKESAPLVVQVSESTHLKSAKGKELTVLALARILPEGDPAILMEIGKVDGSKEVTVILLSQFEEKEVRTGLNMTSLWKNGSGVDFDEMNKSTIRTKSETTIEKRILNCLQSVNMQNYTTPDAIKVNGALWYVCGAVLNLSGEKVKSNGIPILTVLGDVIKNPLLKWAGWNVALKPANEPIVLARKPLAESTVAGNVLRHGTGAINVDGCRVSMNGEHVICIQGQSSTQQSGQMYSGKDQRNRKLFECNILGRWPANLIHDGSPEVLALFPDTKSGKMKADTKRANRDGWSGPMPAETGADTIGDSGSATRFFYNTRSGEPSADRRYTDRGVTNFAAKPGHRREAVDTARLLYCAKASRAERDAGCEEMETVACGGMQGRHDGSMGSVTMGKNTHCTVKPLALMRYLCRLVTPPGGLVLDPFCGSGSTCIAALQEGFTYIGLDNDPESVEIARARLAYWNKPANDR
jgi:hypothetical protein